MSTNTTVLNTIRRHRCVPDSYAADNGRVTKLVLHMLLRFEIWLNGEPWRRYCHVVINGVLTVDPVFLLAGFCIHCCRCRDDYSFTFVVTDLGLFLRTSAGGVWRSGWVVYGKLSVQRRSTTGARPTRGAVSIRWWSPAQQQWGGRGYSVWSNA